jgi:HEAT repeat protein
METLPQVIPLLHDPKSDVRLWAIHTLACDRCKPDENPLDLEPHLIERALHDESLRVRRQAVLSLAYLRRPDPRSAQLFAPRDPERLQAAAARRSGTAQGEAGLVPGNGQDIQAGSSGFR